MSEYKPYLQEGIEIGLQKLLTRDDSVVIVCSDMARCVFSDDFIALHSNRIINLGIAEQNAVSFCGGLSSKGMRVVYVTFACFLTRRAFDELYNSIALPNYNVCCIGLKAGLSESGGASHLALNDIALMKTLPNFCLYEASSAAQLCNLINSDKLKNSPSYIRVCYEHDLLYNIKFDHSNFEQGYIVATNRTENAILVTGRFLSRAMHLSQLLNKKHGIKTTVIQVFQIFPVDTSLVEYLLEYTSIYVIEEHSSSGGLYDEILKGLYRKSNAHVYSLAVDTADYRSGHCHDLMNFYGLNVKNILKKIEISNRM